ncbi:MAG: hypothetical protein U5N26_06690 [Candidatus Marinimicrobia bacterium]|nr:hypothetical protein [Candidatus Neomarinimicrobiota bacterium]
MKTIIMTLAAAFLVFAACSREESRPNIIFIMSDDHAEKAISAYDSTLIRTPNIRPPGQRGDPFQQQLRDQFHLRPQPGGAPDREIRAH